MPKPRPLPAVVHVVGALWAVRFAKLEEPAKLVPGTREILVNENEPHELDGENLLNGVLQAMELEGFAEGVSPGAREKIATCLIQAGYNLT